ncbi:uncharacterized protein LOC112155972 [Oryzias melastigma]|uniref:uncharacterized protein LOC112155972 n=1 Tax=Oryzias melastigma TaxID=30732 RepID=UPI000CF8008A|nr:uncharacterized protein LOC112155972 [Oryzias melastigma]XP_024143836.1 uncharacterized protein LOC112155972 [Oryzias melastigma]
MSLRPFSFPLPETRYFRAGGGLIYKFKIRGGSSFRDEEITGVDSNNQELEEMIRTVLGNLEHLQPFSSAHYTAFPYRKRRVRKCKRAGKKLKFYPFTVLLYLEKNLNCGKQIEKDKSVGDTSKRRRRNSPLEGATAKGFFKDSALDLCNQDTKPEEDPTAFDEPEMTEDTEGHRGPPASPGLLRRLLRHICGFFFRSDGGQTCNGNPQSNLKKIIHK